MKTRYWLVTILLLAVSFTLSAQIACYTNSRNQGIALMSQGHYAEAILVFQSALTCPDKPANNDLQAKIAECRKMVQQQDANRQKRKAEDAQRMAENRRRRDAELAPRGYMEVKDLLFVNSDGSKFIGDPGDPLFESDIRYIQPRIVYRGLASEPKMVEFGIKFLNPDGSLVGGGGTPDGFSIKDTKEVIPAGGRVNLIGFGNKNQSIFEPGTYTCEIWCNGNKLTSGSFTVLKDRNANMGEFVVTGLSLANTTIDNRILSGYGSTLYSDDMRFLRSRMRYDSDRSRKVDLTLKIKHPDGSVTSDTDTYTIQSGYNLEMGLSGLGARRASIFEPGDFEYEIWYDGKKLYTRTFHVIESEWRDALNKLMASGNTMADNKDRYLGDEDDAYVREGLGIYSWTDGTYFMGEWSHGVFSGEGIEIAGATYVITKQIPGSSFYVGSFSRNKRSGRGACYDMDGNLLYDGNFSDGVPTDSIPSSVVDPNRKFEIQESGGDFYIGETLNGKRHGKGIFIGKDGETWYGDWEEGYRQGEGLLIEK